MGTIEIAGHLIGNNNPCFIIAEAGVNHNGQLKMALQLVDAAVAAKVDAIKFQTFKAEAVISFTAPKAAYQQRTTGAGESQLEMVRHLQLSYEQFLEIKAYCEKKDILFLSTPFDHDSADFLDNLGVSAFKIPSGEVNNYPFLEHIACKGKPVILSTGMSYLGEVEQALRVIYATGNRKVILLHCVSNYPADPADTNLRAMQTMTTAFGVPVGYSDHTLGIEVALAAVALGACVVEKHFTLDRTLHGPDHSASLEPDELFALVTGIRTVETALGNGRKEPTASEANTEKVARRSLVAACDIPLMTVITEQHIAIKRPGTGLPPLMREFLVGKRARTFIPIDTLLSLELFEQAEDVKGLPAGFTGKCPVV
jgi:N-acetylneuraminate synthase/N,N'-diacetyllegionaminate synthase